jgi:hypothetical protein
MPEHLTEEFLAESIPRLSLTWAFGSQSQSMWFEMTFLDGSPNAGVLAPQYSFNPDAPRAPGSHGIYLCTGIRQGGRDPFAIVTVKTQNPTRWNYRGHYIDSASSPFPAELWNRQSDSVSLPVPSGVEIINVSPTVQGDLAR